MPFTLAPQHFDVIYDKFSFLSQKKNMEWREWAKMNEKNNQRKEFYFRHFRCFWVDWSVPFGKANGFFSKLLPVDSQAAVALVGSIAVINNNRKMTCQIRSVRIILWIMNGTLLLPLLCSVVLCLCKCLAFGSVRASVFDCKCGCAQRVKLSPPLCCLLR